MISYEFDRELFPFFFLFFLLRYDIVTLIRTRATKYFYQPFRYKTIGYHPENEYIRGIFIENKDEKNRSRFCLIQTGKKKIYL